MSQLGSHPEELGLSISSPFHPQRADICGHAGSAAWAQRTNPLARERAARGAEFVATTEDAVEIGRQRQGSRLEDRGVPNSPQDRSTSMSEKPITPLRQRMIEDMMVRNFVEKTRNDYIRRVKTFTAFLGRSPDTATAEDLRRFQLHQTRTGVHPPR